MNLERKDPSIATAAWPTVAALLILAACLVSIANLTAATQSTQMPLIAVFIFVAVGMIGLAVVQWVVYFRSYVESRINQLRKEQHEIVSQSVPATGKANN